MLLAGFLRGHKLCSSFCFSIFKLLDQIKIFPDFIYTNKQCLIEHAVFKWSKARMSTVHPDRTVSAQTSLHTILEIVIATSSYVLCSQVLWAILGLKEFRSLDSELTLAASQYTGLT